MTVREPPVELPTGETVVAPTPGANCGKIEPEAFTDRLRTRIEDGGGEVLVETPMRSLRTDGNTVVGVDATTADGEDLEIEADAVVLATGGFQGNERLLQEYVTPAIENLWLRANPWSTGDGLTAARDVGAKTTGGMETFYGHNLAAPPANVTPDRYLELTQYYGPFAVAIDERGERFTDESESDLEHTLAQDTAHEADGRAYYVFDSDLYDDEVFSMGHIGTIVERSADRGAEVIRADSSRRSRRNCTLQASTVRTRSKRSTSTTRQFGRGVATDSIRRERITSVPSTRRRFTPWPSSPALRLRWADSTSTRAVASSTNAGVRRRFRRRGPRRIGRKRTDHRSVCGWRGHRERKQPSLHGRTRERARDGSTRSRIRC